MKVLVIALMFLLTVACSPKRDACRTGQDCRERSRHVVEG